MDLDPVGEGRFDPSDYRNELEAAPRNFEVGTSLLFQNERLKVWELRLQPGQRVPFHAHTMNYFWTVIEAGRGLVRNEDGTFVIREYRVGDTQYSEHSAAAPLIHDLDNVGDTVLRFVTVELVS